MRALARFLSRLDRRVIFTLVAIACIAPLVSPLGLPLKPSANAKTVFELVEALKPGDTILMSFDYDPASAPELDPMARAVMRHCFKKNVRIIACALWAQGPPLASKCFRDLARDTLSGKGEYTDKVYGVDFLNVGTHPNYYGALLGMGSDFHAVWKRGMEFEQIVDGKKIVHESKPLSEYPITRNVRTYRDLALVFSLTTGEVGITKYIQVAKTQFQAVVTGGCTAVTALELYPYLNSRQLTGLLEGMKGGADYEFMSNLPGPRPASQAMESQSIVHLLVIAFILVANFVHYVEKRHGLRN